MQTWMVFQEISLLLLFLVEILEITRPLEIEIVDLALLDQVNKARVDDGLILLLSISIISFYHLFLVLVFFFLVVSVNALI